MRSSVLCRRSFVLDADFYGQVDKDEEPPGWNTLNLTSGDRVLGFIFGLVGYVLFASFGH